MKEKSSFKKKERTFWIIFFIFPVIANIFILLCYEDKDINIIRTSTKIGVVETNNEKEWYCVEQYFSQISKTEKHSYTYTLEPQHLKSRNYMNFGIFYSFRAYPQKDVFFEYCFTKSEFYDLNLKDDSDDISYNKERQELIVHYRIPEDYITIKKDEINGIKVIYIAKNIEESKND